MKRYFAQHLNKILIIFCLLVAFGVRLYKIDIFAIFLSDQAIDSFVVRNLLHGNLTLLGPRASAGDFFNGPIVYYLMVPFYWLFVHDPIAGTIFQIVLQIATIPLLFLVTRKMGGVWAAYVALLIFTFSPLLIYYSRATFNAYPSIFFTTFIMYALLNDRKDAKLDFAAGISAGMLVQMHYLLYVYAFFYLIFVAISRKIRSVVLFVIGALLGLSPFILFELRHDDFNVLAVFRHMVQGGGESALLIDRLSQLLRTIGKIAGYDSAFAGLLVSIIALIGVKIVWKQTDSRRLFLLQSIAAIVSLIAYRGVIQAHYVIGMTSMLIILVSIALSSVRIVTRQTSSIVIIMFVVILILFTQNKSLFAVPTEQDAFGLQDERKVVTLISNIMSSVERESPSCTWNVTQDLQQDNRAMPLRYLLDIADVKPEPLSYTDYSTNELLFIVMKNNKKLSQVKTWEFTSLGREYAVEDKYPINESIDMYILRRKSISKICLLS